MSHRHRRFSKRELLGSLHVDYVMSVTDLGLAARTNRWDVLRAFLAAGEARAERLVEEEDGFLILQSVPGEPNTGGIYLFAEPLQSFFWLRFDVQEDTLNGNDFAGAAYNRKAPRICRNQISEKGPPWRPKSPTHPRPPP